MNIRPSRLLALLVVLFTGFVMLGGERAYVLHPEPTPLPSPTPTPIVAPPPVYRNWPQVPSPSYSIQTFAYWHLEAAVRDFDLVQEMGFGWVKQRISWRDVESIQSGSHDWYRLEFLLQELERRDLKLIALIDQTPFWANPIGDDHGPPARVEDYGGFCQIVADIYKGRIAAYQVWNEPNLAREWGGYTPSAAEYTALLKSCYEGIKRSDPEALVISAGLAPTGTEPPLAVPDEQFLREMYAAGAQPYFDMLGVHAPGFRAPPWVSPEEVAADIELGGNRWMAFRHVEDMRAIMEEYDDPHKQIAILEMGWTTDEVNPDYQWFAVTEEQQAEYLVGAYAWARENWQPWIGIMNTIYMADLDWTPEREEYWWAITLPGFPDPVLRPAYSALQAMEKDSFIPPTQRCCRRQSTEAP